MAHRDLREVFYIRAFELGLVMNVLLQLIPWLSRTFLRTYQVITTHHDLFNMLLSEDLRQND